MKNLSKCHWGAFAIDEIFPGNERGKRLVVPERIEGVTPLITAGEVDNGVSAFIANPEQKEYGDSITLDMFANVFYHPYKFNCDDNITVLSNKECSKYAYLFIVVALRMLRGKYSYAYQVRPNRLSKDKIMLPVGKNNKPDYAFMDQYMRAQERKLLAQYKSRIDKLLKVDVLTGGGV